jgi:hypothetical protein
MPYVLAKKATFTEVVQVVEPGNSADGRYEAYEFVAEFKRLKREEVVGLMLENKPTYEALEELLVGWFGLKDGDGADLPFTPEYRAALLQIPHAIVGLWDAFMQGNSGATRKN